MIDRLRTFNSTWIGHPTTCPRSGKSANIVGAPNGNSQQVSEIEREMAELQMRLRLRLGRIKSPLSRPEYRGLHSFAILLSQPLQAAVSTRLVEDGAQATQSKGGGGGAGESGPSPVAYRTEPPGAPPKQGDSACHGDWDSCSGWRKATREFWGRSTSRAIAVRTDPVLGGLLHRYFRAA